MSKVFIGSDGLLVDVIDLKPYIHPNARRIIFDLYKLHRWCMEPLEPAVNWVCRYEDVCALYFRARRHADLFGNSQEQADTLYNIERAIRDYLEDEFA